MVSLPARIPDFNLECRSQSNNFNYPLNTAMGYERSVWHVGVGGDYMGTKHIHLYGGVYILDGVCCGMSIGEVGRCRLRVAPTRLLYAYWPLSSNEGFRYLILPMISVGVSLGPYDKSCLRPHNPHQPKRPYSHHPTRRSRIDAPIHASGMT